MAVVEPETQVESQQPAEDVKTSKKGGKKKKSTKSPTPAKLEESVENTMELRAPSMTPGPRSSRSHTPLSLYIQRRSEDPSVSVKVRSITPFINRPSKEKTPFELGKDVRSQMIAHKMVFDRASYMDVSDDTGYEPVRGITSDYAVVDRASVMDVSNVEVIYMVEEYDDAEYEQQLAHEEAEKKKKSKKGSRKSKSVSIAEPSDHSPSASVERESPKTKTKTIKKKVVRKKTDDDEPEERSPSPVVQLPKLKLDLGGGPKFNKKLFEQKPPQPSGPDAKPPPKSKVVAVPMEKDKLKPQKAPAQTPERESEAREFESTDREVSINPDDEELMDLEEHEPSPEPEPEPEPLTEEEMAQILAEKIEAEERQRVIDEENRRKDKNEFERLRKLRDQMAETERWNRLREEEGIPFMNRIKRFIAQKRNDPSHPCFVNHLPNTVVMEGNDCRISCSVNGTDLQIKWYKNGREIFSNGKYKFTVNLYDVVAMHITNCLKVDSGEYMCVISNGKSKATSTCFVSVHDLSSWEDEPCPPNIDAVEDSYHFANDELLIECRVHGTPRPMVTWYRHDNEVKTNQTYTIVEQMHGVHALLIKRPTTRDTGMYEIRATSSKGEHVRKHIVEFFVTTEKVHY